MDTDNVKVANAIKQIVGDAAGGEDSTIKSKPMPSVEQILKDLPIEGTTGKPVPQDGLLGNSVMFGDKVVEIKSTKMKYQRLRTAAFYTVLESYPLAEILAIDKGYFDEERDGDKCVYDWLVAATDNPELVREQYDNITTETVEKILKIFMRVNAIEEKREALKKRLAEKGAM